MVRLPRLPGRKEHRYAHLLAGKPEDDSADMLPAEPAASQNKPGDERLNKLEQEVADLRAEVVKLREQLQSFQAQFE